VKILTENGADTNHQNSMGYTPLLYCFSRMTETSNIYENKNICLKIAEILLHFGADINYFHHGKTLLMSFCGISMSLDSVQLEMNLEVIQFLLEHGADRTLRAKTNGMTAMELANNHSAKDEVKALLAETK
jgi:ankyrin repeat protein